MNALDILLDAASRPLESLDALGPRLTDEVLNAHPAGHPNSVAWLLWHTGREIDLQLAHLTGLDEIWTRAGFRELFALGEVGDGIGYGHTADEARAVVVVDPQLLVDYVTAAVDALIDYIRTLDESALDDIVDHRWNPPVSRSVRLVSIIDDAAQHIAQAAYICGMPRTAAG
ncbi:mycothiol transferase [Tessaracoccus sp. G1721]